MSLLSFYGPIVGGAILLLFFVAPFFLSRPQKQTTYRVDTNENPALLALVEAVASHVGAPAPTRISASLDNSIRVEKNDDSQLEVILGLPLVAVQTARQTSGFLAHELYKFSSRPSAKTWGLTKLIQGLFERSAYECGEEQQEVVEWGGSLRKPASVTFGFIPWLFERLVAKSCDDLAENMVLDADRSQTRVAGSSTFAMSQLDRRLLDELAIMSQEGFAAAREVGQKSENLPAFYANKLNILKTERPDYVKRVCQELMQTKGETKPCIANRIAVAQSYKDEGIFPADKPSAGLFKDFTRFCRSTTALHYDRHFGTEIEQTKSRLAEESAKKAAAQAAAEAKQKADAEAAIAAQAARVQAQEAADQLAAQQAAAQLAQQQQAAQAQQQQAAAQQPPVPTAVAAAAPVAAAVAGAAAVAAQQTNVPPAPPVAPVPVQPVPVTPPTTPQPPVAQEHLPAVPAAAGVPTVGAASPSENWTGQDDTPDNPIAPRPVDTPSGTPVGQPATQAAPQPIVAQTPTPQTAAAPTPPGQLNQNQDYLSTYLQTDVLTTNYHLFLPFDQPAPAPDPEQAARALLAARQRYEQVYVARKPELNQIASGRLRLRSLQMARTMSLVGLPIGAEGLGLPEASNLAAATACDEQVQTLNSLREQIGELTEQATLRFTLATQLAETKIVAQSVGLQPNEVQSVRVAVSCVAQLKNVLPLVEQLGLQQRQLRCLLFNLNGNEHLEELTTCLSLTAGELAESIRQLQESFPAMTQFAQSFGIEVPAVAQPDEDDAQAIVDEASKRLALFDQLYQQSLTVLAFVADRVERHFSPPPVPQPTT